MQSLLDIFCNARGKNINIEKSCIYTHNIQHDSIEALEELFMFKVEQVEPGFKYLGFFLKPNSYRVKDWHWLIKKTYKRISNWSYRFLSLGGMLTSLKSTLESVRVY